MAVCKYCGAQIDWIYVDAGKKYVPVEYHPVRIMSDRGTETFVTDDGKYIKGKRTLPCAAGGGNLVAYVPHRRYCPGPGGIAGRGRGW